MQITLSPTAERFVQEKLRSGQYTDASEVVAAAIESFIEQETLTPEHEQHLREELRKGIEQAGRGEYCNFTAESVIAEQRQRRQGQR